MQNCHTLVFALTAKSIRLVIDLARERGEIADAAEMSFAVYFHYKRC